MTSPAGPRALTFDCYGTIIDWESGILSAARQAFDIRPGDPWTDEHLLERFAVHEAAIEAEAYRSYREVLAEVARRLAADRGRQVPDAAVQTFAGSVADWPAFPDAEAALARLAARYRLVVITNCDDDLFAASAARVGDPFEFAVTAQQVQAYKPRHDGFHEALRRLGIPREQVLHVAQSLFHDHVPAGELGLRSVWVDRRAGRPGSGATPPANARPDATVPDLTAVADLLGV